MELLSVKLGELADPRLADTHRVSVDGLEPPPWLTPPAGPLSDAPTVLLPVVRKRRIRRRVIAGTAAALVGAAFGVWFALDTPAPGPAAAEASGVIAATPSAAPSSVPPRLAEVPALASAAAAPPVPPVAPVASTRPAERAVVARVPVRLHAAASSTPSSAAWFQAEPPRAWIK